MPRNAQIPERVSGIYKRRYCEKLCLRPYSPSLFIFLLFYLVGCSADPSAEPDSGDAENPGSTGNDGSADASAEPDSGGAAQLDFDQAIKYLFQADVNDVSMSLYFEPREGYSGNDYYLYCDSDHDATISVPSKSSSHLAISDSDRYIFSISNLVKDADYNCGIKYRSEDIVYEGKKLFIQLHANKTAYPLRYIIIADPHGCAFEDLRSSIAADMTDAVGVISLGDTLLADDLSDPVSYEKKWYDFLDGIRDILFAAPFYPLLGNHDLGNSKDLFSMGREAFLEVFKLPRIGQVEHSYYSVERGGNALVFLDTPGLSVTDPQLSLIDEVTSNNASSIILLHHQVFGVENTPTQGGPAITTPSPDVFHQYLESRGVHLVMNGHRHYYHAYKKDEIYYITVPTVCEEYLIPNSGRVFDQNNGTTIVYDDVFYGYGVLEIYEDKFLFTLKGFHESDNKFVALETIEIAG